MTKLANFLKRKFDVVYSDNWVMKVKWIEKLYYSLWPTAMEADVKRFTFEKWINKENQLIKKIQTFLVYVDLNCQFLVFGIYRQAMNFHLLTSYERIEAKLFW